MGVASAGSMGGRDGGRLYRGHRVQRESLPDGGEPSSSPRLLPIDREYLQALDAARVD